MYETIDIVFRNSFRYSLRAFNVDVLKRKIPDNLSIQVFFRVETTYFVG